MHLRPRLLPGPCWGSLQRSPDSITGFGDGNREEGMERAMEEKEKGSGECKLGWGSLHIGFSGLDAPIILLGGVRSAKRQEIQNVTSSRKVSG